MTHLATEREAFEAWYAKRHPVPTHENSTWAHCAKMDDWEVWQARAGAAPAAVAPQGEYPHEQMDAMALARYKVVPSHASMLWSHAVVAGDGVQQLYVGREAECQNMARKFAGAFLDGAFAFHSMAAAPTTQAAPALEAPAAPAGWKLVPEKPTDAMLGAAQKAWLADPLRRSSTLYAAALAAAPQAPAAPGMAVTALAVEIIAALEADEKDGGYDLTSGLFGPKFSALVRRWAASEWAHITAPQAPAAPADVLCYIRPGATLPERHGFEVCRATDVGAMAVMGNGRVAAPAEPASKRIGQILNPESEQSQATGAVVVAEIMSNGYNGQVLWKGKVPPVGTLLYAAPQAAPAAPAVDAKAHDWRENASYGGEICAECGAAKGSRRGNAPCAWPPEPLDVCTDPYNCARCKTHPAHRGDMHHAGISRIGGSA